MSKTNVPMTLSNELSGEHAWCIDQETRNHQLRKLMLLAVYAGCGKYIGNRKLTLSMESIRIDSSIADFALDLRLLFEEFGGCDDDRTFKYTYNDPESNNLSFLYAEVSDKFQLRLSICKSKYVIQVFTDPVTATMIHFILY